LAARENEIDSPEEAHTVERMLAEEEDKERESERERERERVHEEGKEVNLVFCCSA